jgi:hypothetical protein
MACNGRVALPPLREDAQETFSPGSAASPQVARRHFPWPYSRRPGPRRRMVEDLQAPQLPDVGEPRNGVEKGVRTGTTIATDVLVSTLAVPALRRAFLTKFLGPQRGAPLMFEPGAAAARAGSRFEKGVRTLAEVTESSILDTPPSKGASNLAQLVFDFHASDIPKMSLIQATNARKRILTKIPDF